MKGRSTLYAPGWWTRLVMMVLAAGLVLFNQPVVFHSPALPADTQVPLHDEPVETQASVAFPRFPGELIFYRDASGETLTQLLVDVAVDEEFVEQVGDGWRATPGGWCSSWPR